MFVLLCSVLAIANIQGATAQPLDWSKVNEAMGRNGTVTDDVHRYSFPRTDLEVTLDGLAIKPALRSVAGWRSSPCRAARW
jgi:hypothetical protein